MNLDIQHRWITAATVATLAFSTLIFGFPAKAQNIFKSRIEAHWSADASRFWYRNDLPDGGHEFIGVDPDRRVRAKLFDHGEMASALAKAGIEADPNRLPIESIEFVKDSPNQLKIRATTDWWLCDLEKYTVEKISAVAETPGNPSSLQALPPDEAPTRSGRRGRESAITFTNRSETPIKLFWIDNSGNRRAYDNIPPGESHDQHTFGNHLWIVENEQGAILAIFRAKDTPHVAIVDGKGGDHSVWRARSRRARSAQGTSPDGRYRASIEDHNIVVQMEDGNEKQLTDDGVEDNRYDMLSWSPDSKTLIAFQIVPGERKEVHMIESSPRDGGRANLRSHTYALPGDRFSTYQLHLFDIASGNPIQVDVDLVDFGRPRIRWKDDERHFTYEKTDRGHQRFRVIEIDSHTGKSRNLIDEQTDTFIGGYIHGSWMTNYLDQSDEIIYVSEKDGWRHLYLIDAKTGKIANQITKGKWVVRGIDEIDETNRQVWFRASGMNPDQDPYLVHYYRVDFDGSNLVALTAGNGTHRISYSPDRKYIVDTYSRADLPPVHELRRVSDGKLLCDLEKADISRLEAEGWSRPEVFVAKGRDDQTDIWGLIHRPANLDPSKQYPIIEDIYAGPHNSHVPKSFSPRSRYKPLTDAGFIVVQIDGMGTANRSKAFHDVCWQNLKDAGFPDRIAWIKAAAKKYPYMDIDRVGIFGMSAGGQNAAGAVLFHPEFYKVAVAACGCHDNRMDKSSWNEQWMGYPVGPHYAESSNIENAHRLQGKLMLIVGELDTNVPPESTYRFVDALIKAGKDFDFVLLPGAGHTTGGRYGARRRQDFFVKHLLGKDPPDRNKNSN